MCNRYGLKHPIVALNAEFSAIRIPLIFPTGLPNLEPREEIRPTDPAPVVRAAGDGFELATLRWGFPPPRPKAGPVINFRSEGRRFGRGRCLIPASHFFEFTGDRYPKTMWRFTKADEPMFCIAGLWRPGEGGAPDAFTMLTTDPGPDLADVHDRQIVILERRDWAEWLNAEQPRPQLLRPLPAGSLVAKKVR